MSDVMTAWLVTAVAGSVLSGAMSLAWRRKRLVAGARWHVIATAAMGASLAAPLMAAVGPRVMFVFYHPAHMTTLELPAITPAAVGIVETIYLAGALVLLSRLVAAWRHLRELRAESVPLPLGAVPLADRAGLSVEVVRSHPRVRSPLTFGWRRPLVLLPTAATEWSDERIRAVLLHERAHGARRDVLWNLLASVYVAAFWPNPFAWRLRRQARLAAELACDHAASNRIGHAAYAAVLVGAAREFLAAAPTPGRIAPGAETDLYERLDALLDNPAHPSISRGLTVCAALIAAGAIMGASTIRVAVSTSSPGLQSRHAVLHQHRH
jgi:beta-lactamase regulating signal transducer with metallopeptidase domain